MNSMQITVILLWLADLLLLVSVTIANDNFEDYWDKILTNPIS